MLSIVVAEDNLIVRQGILGLLATQPDFEVVAAVDSLPSLLRAVDDHQPDVVITDIRMPPSGTDEGIRAAEELRRTWPDVGVVVLSQYVEPAYALALFDGGSAKRAYLLKERVGDVGELARAIREVAGGGSVVDPKVVEALVSSRTRARPAWLDRLSPREREVLAEMATGKNNGAIAATLFLSDRAVEKHINSLFSKLALTAETEVHRRVKAVLLYLAE